MKKILCKLRKFKKGFSLMETMIWISIVGVFTSLVAVSGVGMMNRAKVKAAQTSMKSISTALLDYYEEEGSFPTKDQGLDVLLGDYIQKNADGNNFKDPWKNDYDYEQIDDGEGFILKSFGADKQAGGTGVKEDIVIENSLYSNSGNSDAN